MYLCQNCQRAINAASAVCPYCGAAQTEPEPGQPRKSKSISKLKISAAFIIVVAGIWAIIWFALPLQVHNPQPAAQSEALEAIRSLQQQLATYANGAGNFPSTLESLGDPARQASENAMAGGYAIRYAPARLDANGNAHAYTLLALPRNYGYESFYTDQTGAIHFTNDNRPATLQDPVLK